MQKNVMHLKEWGKATGRRPYAAICRSQKTNRLMFQMVDLVAW
jgi:hypothetical protein